ncbi:MAG TPA: MBL fold metallo-hydrolase [Elusimicrobiota bacterium]|nr:MBL fold metallo-hydrolase [Elusimicrobiota bacterium]
MPPYLRQIPVGPMENFCYLVGDPAVKKCWIVDPAWDVKTALDIAAADGYTVDGALISHSHFDHCNAVDSLLADRNIPLYVQPRELEYLEKGAPRGLFWDLPKDHVRPVKGGDVLSLGATNLTVLHTPGHTPGSQCFLVDGRLFSGDTLFLGTCGRCDLPGGNPHELFETLNGVLAKLPDDTVLFPGHNYSSRGTQSTLREEKKENRFFSVRRLDDFLEKLGF